MIASLLSVFLIVFAACGAGGASGGAGSSAAGAGPDAGSVSAEAENDAGGTSSSPASSGGGNDILIAYFSHTGNTEAVAQQIADLTGGTTAEIRRAEEYGDLQEEAGAEILQGIRPEITVSADNVEDYDIVFVGYPIWWDEAPAMIGTFLESYDFSGKTIIPFCTSASDSIDNSLHIFREICPDANIAEGLTANDDADIEPWLQELGVIG